MKLPTFILLPALLIGCASNNTPRPECDGSADCPKCSAGTPCEKVEKAPAHASAELPDRFKDMDPAKAAQRGPNGIAEARDVFHELLRNHDAIKRTVEDIPGGVRTLTTSDDPQIAALIQLHVRQMAARYDAGMPVRNWDPLFTELLKHYDKVTLTIEDVDNGLRVTETSEDPQVVLLIRQHAHHGVSEFVERGFDRAHEETPLPEGYQR